MAEQTLPARDRTCHGLGLSTLKLSSFTLYLLAALLVPVSAWGIPITVVDESATFKTIHQQSQFGSQAQVTVGQDQFLGFEFDTGEVRFGHIEETFIGDFGGAATIDVSGKFGLETNYTLSTGKLDISLPHSVRLELSDNATLNPILTPGFRVGTGADNFLKSEFPSYTFGSALVAQLDASVKVDACVFGCFLSGQEIIPSVFRGIDTELRLLEYDSADNTFSIFGTKIDANILDTANVPVGQGFTFPQIPIPVSLGPPPVQGTIDVSIGQPAGNSFEADESSINQVVGGIKIGSLGTDLVTLRFAPPGQKLNVNQQLATTGADIGDGGSELNQDVVSLNIDVDALATGIGLLPVPLGATLSVGPVDLTADILDLSLIPAIGFGQEIEFNSNPTLTLDFSRPVKVNGEVVSSYEVDPRQGAPLSIEVDREAVVTPVFNLAPQVRNVVDLTVRTAIELEALKFKLAVADQTVFATDPLFKKNLGGSPPETLASIFSNTFGLENANAATAIGTLPAFKIAEGVILPGQDAQNAKAPTSQNGAISSYNIDYVGCGGVFDQAGDVNCGMKKVKVATFAGPDRDIRSSSPALGIEFILGRVGDIRPFHTLAQPVTVAVKEANAPDDALIPHAFEDTTIKVINGFEAIIHNSDAVTVQASERSSGTGLDSSAFLEFDLLSNGDNGELLFAKDINFSFGAAPQRPYGTTEPLRFESLAFDGLQLHGLLDAIGDTDGLTLNGFGGAFDVAFQPQVVNGNLTSCGGIFSIGANDTCLFNFADDFVNKDLISDGLMLAQGFDSSTGVGAFNISDFDVNLGDNLVDTLLTALGDPSGPLNPSSLSIGISFDELLENDIAVNNVFAPDGSGIGDFHINQAGCYPTSGFTRRCTELELQRTDLTPQFPLSRVFVEAGTESVLAGDIFTLTEIKLTDTTVDAKVRSAHVFVQPVPDPPVPDPVLPGTFNPVVAKKSGGTCVAVDANGKPDCGVAGEEIVINITTTDPVTGAPVTQSQEWGRFLTSNNNPDIPPPPVLEPPVPGLVDGLVSTDGLSPTDVFGNTFVYDFDNVAGWGDLQTYTERVFRGNNLLSDGITLCSAGVGNVTDGQVVGRSPGANTNPPVLADIDLRSNSASSVAPCFETLESELIFGVEAPAFLEFPFAMVLAFDVEGPKFTSVSLPSFGGDNALLLHELTIQVLDEVVGTLGLGETFYFDSAVDGFLVTGLDVNRFLLDNDPRFIDTELTTVFGLTVDEAGTVIRVTGRAPSTVPEPGTSVLVLAGILGLTCRRWRRRFS